MEEDVGQDDTLRDKNITVAASGGSSSSSDVDIRKTLESLLLGSMQKRNQKGCGNDYNQIKGKESAENVNRRVDP